MMPLSDSEIFRRVQNGEQELFGQIVVRYADRLLRVAESKLGNRAAAEDVVQETFLAAFAARMSYNPQFAVSTWLWTILLNLCLRRWKQRQSRPWDHATSFSSELALTLPESTRSALSGLIAQEQNEKLHQLLAELPEPQADALRLRFFGGLKFDEIATATECTLSGAKRRVKTGLRKLAEQIRMQELAAVNNGALRENER